ncbi:SWIM zinc finger family protein [Chitinophaga rhizophila]|nr:SWIM zinc finger family protein [Chitinophaga rhizophila]
MLNLKNFELQISDKIVFRGREYFENDAVVDLEETEEGLWYAEVMGSDTYEVEVKLSGNKKIESYSCDCPYDGDMCKHMVAVLFILREELLDNIVKKKTATKTDFKKLLQKISLEEYQEFIQAHAASDKKFKSLVQRYFADKDSQMDIAKSYTKHLKSLIRSRSSGDYIDYRSIYGLANEINGLLDESQLLIEKGTFLNAFIIARSVLIEVIEIITYCDDSSGYIGDIINSSIGLIKNIAEEVSVTIEVQKEIFSFVQSAISLPIYFDYGDFGYDMVNIYSILAIKLNKHTSYLNFIDGQIKKASTAEYSYRKDYFLVRKIAFLKTIGNISDAQALVQKNLDIVDVRRGEVSRLVEERDFFSAKKLIIEGIEIARKKDHPGIVTGWEKELLQIAVLENDIETIRYYTKHFAFDRGFHLIYYNQWKSSYDIAAWEQEIEEYIEEIISRVETKYQNEKGKVWYSPHTLLLGLLAPIYIEEKYWDRLLSLISNEIDLDRLLQYHDHLLNIYPVQLLALYLPAFERKGDIVGNRREYADLASKMIMVIETIPVGKDEIIFVAEEICRKYPRRPAMIDELRRVINIRTKMT